jgi:hypothetical protein
MKDRLTCFDGLPFLIDISRRFRIIESASLEEEIQKFFEKGFCKSQNNIDNFGQKPIIDPRQKPHPPQRKIRGLPKGRSLILHFCFFKNVQHSPCCLSLRKQSQKTVVVVFFEN